MPAGSLLQSISLYKLQVPLHEPFVISLGPLTHAQNVVVVLRTADGRAGYGECSPFLTINGESADTGLVVGGGPLPGRRPAGPRRAGHGRLPGRA